MEDSFVTISRAKGSVTYPASFLLVAAASPCPCGYYGDQNVHVPALGSYPDIRKNLGPILDRIDIHVDVPSVETQN